MTEQQLSGREYAALQALFGMRSSLDVTAPTLEKRAEDAGVAEDFQKLRDLSRTVMDALLRTIPRRKLEHVMVNLTNTRVYIRVEAPGLQTKSTQNMVLVPAESLDYVLNGVIDCWCMMCDKTEVEGRKCPHRRAMEDCLPHAVKVSRESERCRFADMAIGLEEPQEV